VPTHHGFGRDRNEDRCHPDRSADGDPEELVEQVLILAAGADAQHGEL